MTTHRFWPLDYNPEDEIYESVAWDLPGFRPADHRTPGPRNVLTKQRAQPPLKRPRRVR
jgi:hypothetical protein